MTVPSVTLRTMTDARRSRRAAGLGKRLLRSRVVDTLTTPHGVDRYLEQLHPLFTVREVRARVVDVVPETSTATTVVLRPNSAWDGFRAGQHVQFGVEMDGARRTRCFSVSSSEHRADGCFTVTVKAHDGGRVSRYLRDGLRIGTIVHLSPADGEFVLADPLPASVVLISGGSGVTPAMSMLRTLRDSGARTDLTFLYYARTREDALFGAELDEIATSCPWARIVRVYTREPGAGALEGRFRREHLQTLGIDPLTTPAYACGPAGMIDAVRSVYGAAAALDQLKVEYFKVPTPQVDAADATGTVTFTSSATTTDNTGRTILEQAEAAGLQPEFGCRMGICHSCTVRKNSGAVRNVINGEVAADTDEDIQICITAPVGDVSVAL